MNRNKITLISSFATDRIFDEANKLIRKQEGGPALFISNAFKQAKLSFTVVPTPKIDVDVVLKDRNEFGKIESSATLDINYELIDTPYLLISPILNEFSLTNINDYKGKVFLDAQGFTREAGELGKKKNWNTSEEIENSIFCLKIADYELPYVSSSFVDKQKAKILLLTHGSKGCTLYAFGRSFSVKPNEIIKTEETLGAGDTFFANFTVKYIETLDTLGSAKFATNKTIKFLKSKKTR